jgi:hypothetical protein
VPVAELLTDDDFEVLAEERGLDAGLDRRHPRCLGVAHDEARSAAADLTLTMARPNHLSHPAHPR